MQTAIEPERVRLGILPVTVNLIEQMFCLPEGYQIVGISYDRTNRIINFTLKSEHLPEVDTRNSLPQLSLLVTSERFPGTPPEYEKITTKVTLR